MSDGRLEPRISAWLRADAPDAAPSRLLDATLAEVATLGQDRPPVIRPPELLNRPLALPDVPRWILVAAAVGLLVVGALAVASIRPPDPLGSNGWIAYATQPGLTREGGPIWLVRPGQPPFPAIGGAGGSRRCLTFSADGALLAYVEDERVIVVAAVDAEGVVTERSRILAHVIRSMPCPQWAPDNRHILALSWGETIVSAPLDGKRRQITEAFQADSIRSFAVSSDGAWLAVAHSTGARLYPLRGGEPVEVIGGFVNEVSWSPDSSRLAAWGSVDAGGPGAVILRVDGAGVTIEQVIEDGRGVAWSPDGRRLALPVGSGVRILGADGSEHAAPGLTGRILWSPDGALLAFARSREGTASDEGPPYELVVVRPDGSDLRVLGEVTSLVGWSPDGQWLLELHSLTGTEHGVRAFPIDGDPPLTIAGPTPDLYATRSTDIAWGRAP